MECLLTFLVVLVIFAVITSSAARVQSRSARRRGMYQRLAKRYSGHYSRGGVLARPTIRFAYGETRALFREGKGRGPLYGKCSELQIDWPDGRLVLEIARATGVERVASQQSVPVDIEASGFERDYFMRSTNQREMANILSEGVRWQINRLRQFLDDDSVYVLINRGKLIVQKQSLMKRFADLEQFLQMSLELYDQAMLTQAKGIEFVQSDIAKPLGEVICKVCGESIETDFVYCRRCKTPHHGDCWQYNGACSVYGCLETEFTAPRTVQPLNQPKPQ